MCIRDRFHLEGFCLLNKGLSAAQVSECADHCEAAFQHNIHTVNILGLGQTLEDVGFSTFKLRNRGRYDFTVESLSSLDFLGEKAPWMPLVRELLGHDCVHLHTGAGSWHGPLTHSLAQAACCRCLAPRHKSFTRTEITCQPARTCPHTC
eukprot:TRINITY_DN2614_c0_g1_i1.p1 TRINITY_DN2614_c0_g1~~TRINITY_DN2614_c0_g1_i1.p1  ORF type:complete len:150 (-),score=35.33 TRINITY_DN2614_c0_g1_i1:1008-1457(-)